MLETFTPPREPSVKSYGYSQAPRIFRTDFGDGYSQRVPDGINNAPRSLKMKLQNLTVIERDAVLEFIEAKRGAGAFYYQPPNEGVLLIWSCPKWSVSPMLNKQLWEIDLNFTQEFDLDG